MIYQPVMGLEVHVQLHTKSKVFATEGFQFGAEANQWVSPITLAHPGALPSINQVCIEYAIRLGLATNCEIARHTYFARKNYFYPDSPKGYQLSQAEHPICENGYLDLELAEGKHKRIGIERIHLEEDAGKSIHDQDPSSTQIDLNRAGTGLLEIVTRPDFRTIEEVGIFLTEIRKLVRYLEISDADMEKGNMRCDANISVRLAGTETLGTRVEVKNLNSINFTRKAIRYEIERQISLLTAGQPIKQETRTYDINRGITASMREKETSDDYRYFPEPDLQPLALTDATISAIQASLPELPKSRFKRYVSALGLSPHKAAALTEQKAFSDYFEAVMAAGCDADAASTWLLGPVNAYLNAEKLEIETVGLPPKQIAAAAALVKEGKVSFSAAKAQLFPLMIKYPNELPATLARSNNLILADQSDELEAAMHALMKKHPDEVARFRKGKKQLAGFFVGQLMRQFKGKADPKAVNRVVRDELNRF